ncbi:UNVERIFIED_CONTAM: hypothetical protein FKN15_023630 [Acipenser sinensis]
MEDTMWLIAITFLTIGYGDITPQTTCGKTVCLLTGVMVGTRFRAERNLRSGFTHFQGVGCTAMLVAVVAKNLSLNKAEKHVHQFMMDIKHTKKSSRHSELLRPFVFAHGRVGTGWHRTSPYLDPRASASSEETIEREITLSTRQEAESEDESVVTPTGFTCLETRRAFRKARLKQRKLRDHANEMVDLSKLQVMMCDLSGNWSTSYKEMERRIGSMEQKMDELSRAFQETSQLISRALQHRAGDNSVA